MYVVLRTDHSGDAGNGSDVFGSDICTCKPYLTYAIEEEAGWFTKGSAWKVRNGCYWYVHVICTSVAATETASAASMRSRVWTSG